MTLSLTLTLTPSPSPSPTPEPGERPLEAAVQAAMPGPVREEDL